MKAYVYGANGAAIADIPKPSPKGTQVLVKVHACGLNRADLGCGPHITCARTAATTAPARRGPWTRNRARSHQRSRFKVQGARFVRAACA